MMVVQFTPYEVGCHEAGHAVVSLRLMPERPVRRMWIKTHPLEGWSGESAFGPDHWTTEKAAGVDPADAPELARYAKLEAAQYLAGILATGIAKGMSPLDFAIKTKEFADRFPTWADLPGTDVVCAQERLRWVGGDLREGFLSAWRMAHEVIAADWSHVSELGVALAAQQRLSGVKVMRWWNGKGML